MRSRGYICPETVCADLFYAVEGDRRERMLGDKRGWTSDRLRRVALKHFLWIMIAWWTGGAWVLYSPCPDADEGFATCRRLPSPISGSAS